MTNAAVKTANAELNLTLTRVFDAPREAVFRAWTDPAQVAKWLGTRDVRLEVTDFDVRVGGAYRFVAHHEDGRAPAMRGIYREIAPPERLSFTWVWEQPNADGPPSIGHETLVTVTFKSLGQRTEMTLRHEKFDNEDFRDGHDKGWTASFDKLAEFLAAARRI